MATFEYLNDLEFLTRMDKLNIRTQYAKIVLLSFDEQPIREIQGNITAGNLTVNGSSAVRRTVSLTMLANENNSGIENVENEISLNKKVRIFVGYKNPLKEYAHYGDIIWYPCGMFILSSASINRGTTGWTISITGKDKMCMLDGTVGGVIPATTVFSELYIEDVEGNIEIQYPTIFRIIYEAVHHWGGENPANIIISDLEETARLLVKYTGDNAVWFNDNFDSISFVEDEGHKQPIYSGQDAGYQMTDFTYPGELTLGAGSTVVGLLDKIKSILSNFEYFYDVDGRFHFQQIKNYLNTGSPLLELQAEDYTRSYNNAKFLYSLTDLDTTTAINRNPKYDNIKNDFYVWGQRTDKLGNEIPIRYHLAIDAKPLLDLATKYMWEMRNRETNELSHYSFTDTALPPEEEGYHSYTVGPPSTEWREELYRRALYAQTNGSVYDNYYDSEMIAEWRNLYDPTTLKWQEYGFWNPDITNDPSQLNFWIDFIDTGSEMGKYSINQIGRRTKIVNNTKLLSVYNKSVPDLIFISPGEDIAKAKSEVAKTEATIVEMEEKLKDEKDPNLIFLYQATLDEATLRRDKWQAKIDTFMKDNYEQFTITGQKYFILQQNFYDLFKASSTSASCFDQIREMLYQNLNYNTTITITCLPKYYMEPNNIIYIEDKKSNICGNYQITQFTLPLAYNGTMNITATEVLTRV